MLERREMIRQAKQLAINEIDGAAACGDTQYEKLTKLGDKKAVKTLAMEFLYDARMNIISGD